MESWLIHMNNCTFNIPHCLHFRFHFLFKPWSLNKQIHEKMKALQAGFNPGPSKHRLHSNCFIHYAMTPFVNAIQIHHNNTIHITYSRECSNVLLFGVTRCRLSQERIKNHLFMPKVIFLCFRFFVGCSYKKTENFLRFAECWDSLIYETDKDWLRLGDKRMREKSQRFSNVVFIYWSSVSQPVARGPFWRLFKQLHNFRKSFLSLDLIRIRFFPPSSRILFCISCLFFL